MDPDAGARTLYLVLLGAFLLFAALRGGLAIGRLIRTLIVWALILAGLALGYTVYTGETGHQAASITTEGDTIVLSRARDGHFHATVEINGVPIPFIVDTGATELVLSRDDAARAGIDTASLAYIGRARTANGTVRTAPVTLRTVALGTRAETGLRATVSEGDMGVSLLGMAYLDRFGRIEIAGNEMRLVP